MASRRQPPPPPQRPVLTIARKQAGIRQIDLRIQELEELDPGTVKQRFNDPRMTVIETAIDETLSDMFGHGTTEYHRYAGATHLDNGPVSMGGWGEGRRNEAYEAQQYLQEGKQQAIALLQQAKRRLQTEIEMEGAEVAAAIPAAAGRPPAIRRDIFVVHGHDEGMREAVARFLEQLDFRPIILHEQVNRGRTVIEKVEEHGGSVGFAVVLLSPDDEGSLRGVPPAPRARQNVVLELGYFLGLLGRARVCALKRGDIEFPSDFGGVVFENYDAGGGWKQRLAQELQAADYDIDWNRVMRN
ncbi:MAG: TIR domain-containing protein [Hyphomicrobiaceae bacterium]